MLIKLNVVFFRLPVVVKTNCVKYSELFSPECKFNAPYYISSCDLSSSAASVTLVQIRHRFGKNLNRVCAARF